MKRFIKPIYLIFATIAIIISLSSCDNDRGSSNDVTPTPPETTIPITGRVIVEFSRDYAASTDETTMIQNITAHLGYEYEVTAVEPLAGDSTATLPLSPSIGIFEEDYSVKANTKAPAGTTALYMIYINNASIEETAEVKALLQDFSPVVSVTSDYKITVNFDDNKSAEGNPDEPYRETHYIGWNRDKIEQTMADDYTNGSDSIKVAVIDTGVDCNHEALAAVCESGYDFANDDNDPSDDDDHGTHVTGIISAQHNAENGVVGIAPGVRIIPIKLIDHNRELELSDIIRSINYAVEQGADIINISWYFIPDDHEEYTAFRSAIEMARDADVLITIAAGNSRYPLPDLPARFETENIISVAWSDINDELGDISDVKPGGGGSNYHETMVDLAAPGEDIYSTGLDNTYFYGTGTSMAAPHVAGVAALIKSMDPELDYASIKNLILSTVDESSHLAGKVLTNGRINAYSAVLMTVADNANLRGIEISEGSLSPEFNQENLTYNVSVGDTIEEISLTPSTINPYATITINGSAVDSGVTAGPYNLEYGDNIFNIQVVSEDVSNTNTYTITVTRKEPVIVRIAFTSNKDGNYEVYSVLSDGTEEVNLSQNAGNGISGSSFDGYPALSPDGSKVAFLTGRNSGPYTVYSLYTVNADGTGLTEITDTNYDCSGKMDWSPDGTAIVFSADYNDEGTMNIYRAAADGTGIISITTGYESKYNPRWSPDGSIIAYDTNSCIYTVTANGSDIKTELTATTDSISKEPRWSPDGSMILFETNRDGNWEVYLMDADGTDEINLSNSTNLDVSPWWSPDGSQIVFVSDRNDSTRNLFVMNPNGTGISPLTNNYITLYRTITPEWAADDSEIFYISYTGSYRLRAIRPSGTGDRQVLTYSVDQDFGFSLWK